MTDMNRPILEGPATAFTQVTPALVVISQDTSAPVGSPAAQGGC
jgi:hypothetical protein